MSRPLIGAPCPDEKQNLYYLIIIHAAELVPRDHVIAVARVSNQNILSEFFQIQQAAGDTHFVYNKFQVC